MRDRQYNSPQQQIMVHLGYRFMPETQCGIPCLEAHHVFGHEADSRLALRDLVVMDPCGVQMHNDLADGCNFYPLLIECAACVKKQQDSIAATQKFTDQFLANYPEDS